MKLHPVLLLSCFALTDLGCDDADRPPLPDAQAAVLDDVLGELAAQLDDVGVALAVRTGEGAQWVGVAGIREGDVPLGPHDVALFGSVTKTVTATVTLQLVEEGLLSLDETIDTFDIDLPNAETITIEQLLGHRSGLFNYTDDEAYMASLDRTPRPPEEIFALVRDHEPLFAPDAAWTYANTNYVALGVVIEQVTGEPLQEVYRDRVFGPLGLHDTGLADRDPWPGPLAHGYRIEGDVLRDVTFDHDKTAQGPDGALFSTVDDMLTWTLALYGGSVLEPATLEAMLAPRSADIVAPLAMAYGFASGDYGLGAISLDDTELGPVWGHAGNIRGYGAYIGYVPALDLAFVFYATRDDADGLAVARQVMTALHGFAGSSQSS